MMMKKFFLYSIVILAAILTGCNKDPVEPVEPPKDGEEVVFYDGAIIVDNSSEVTFQTVNSRSEGVTNSETPEGGGMSPLSRLGMPQETRANLEAKYLTTVAHNPVSVDGVAVNVQASHVKIVPGGHLFVSYNKQHEGNYGGVRRYSYTQTGDPSNPIAIAASAAMLEMKHPNVTFQVNSLDYANQRLFIAGASDEPSAFGLADQYTTALLIVAELDAAMRFSETVAPKVITLGSWQATSVCYFDGKIYVTTGDNRHSEPRYNADGQLLPAPAPGGLFVLNAATLERENFVELEDARSVTADNTGVYVLLGGMERALRFNHSGARDAAFTYVLPNNLQQDAKSDVLVWQNNLFLSQNQHGMNVISAQNPNILLHSLSAPNSSLPPCNFNPDGTSNLNCWNFREDVTNSLNINTVSLNNRDVNLLLLANGRQGVYMYETVINSDGAAFIWADYHLKVSFLNANNQPTGSTNHVEAKDNAMFVAGGSAGVHVVSISANHYRWTPLEMAHVPCGVFVLGTLIPQGHDTPPVPLSTVVMSSFYMGKYEVTQEQWEFVMGYNNSRFQSDPASGVKQGRHPVENVNWYEILVFANRLSILEGLTPAYSINGSVNPDDWGALPTSENSPNRAAWDAVAVVAASNGYRFPTEAQWEYAARGGHGSPDGELWSGGAGNADLVSWHSGNSGGMTHEVGSLQPNSLGLYDMSGNVWEWVWDWRALYTPELKIDPTGPAEAEPFGGNIQRILRSGSWNQHANNTRVWRRGRVDPWFRADAGGTFGFRLARPAEQACNLNFNVTFIANGATSGAAPSPVTAIPGANIQIPDNGSLARTGYIFSGWNTQADGDGINYLPNATFPIIGNVVLYAQWEVIIFPTAM